MPLHQSPTPTSDACLQKCYQGPVQGAAIDVQPFVLTIPQPPSPSPSSKNTLAKLQHPSQQAIYRIT